MVILEHTDVIVADCQRVLAVDKEHVVEAGVLEVVHACCCQECKHLAVLDFGLLKEFALHAEHVECLAQIGRVGLVVVSHRFVAVLDRRDKVHQLVEVKLHVGKHATLLKEHGQQSDHFIVIRGQSKLENVEI